MADGGERKRGCNLPRHSGTQALLWRRIAGVCMACAAGQTTRCWRADPAAYARYADLKPCACASVLRLSMLLRIRAAVCQSQRPLIQIWKRLCIRGDRGMIPWLPVLLLAQHCAARSSHELVALCLQSSIELLLGVALAILRSAMCHFGRCSSGFRRVPRERRVKMASVMEMMTTARRS